MINDALGDLLYLRATSLHDHIKLYTALPVNIPRSRYTFYIDRNATLLFYYFQIPEIKENWNSRKSLWLYSLSFSIILWPYKKLSTLFKMFSFYISFQLHPIWHGVYSRLALKFTSTITRFVIICWLFFLSTGLFQEVMDRFSHCKKSFLGVMTRNDR